MGFLFAVTVLGLLFLSNATTPDCFDHVKHLDFEDRDKINGTWILVAGVTDHLEFHNTLQNLSSSWIEIVPTSEKGVVTLKGGDRINGTCVYSSTKITFSDSSARVQFPDSPVHHGHYLETCPNCLVWNGTNDDDNVTVRNLFMFRRTPTLPSSDLETFKRHLTCLNFSQSYFSYDEMTDFCPNDEKTTLK